MKLKRKKAFKIFVAEVEKWVNYFGFMDWDINVKRCRKNKYMAQCLANDSGKCVTLCLGNLKLHHDMDDVRRSAFHEVCELLLHDFWGVFELKGVKRKTRVKMFSPADGRSYNPRIYQRTGQNTQGKWALVYLG